MGPVLGKLLCDSVPPMLAKTRGGAIVSVSALCSQREQSSLQASMGSSGAFISSSVHISAYNHWLVQLSWLPPTPQTLGC